MVKKNDKTATEQYTSTPVIRAGIYPHMPIAVTTSGGQFVTRVLWLPGQFIAPG